MTLRRGHPYERRRWRDAAALVLASASASACALVALSVSVLVCGAPTVATAQTQAVAATSPQSDGGYGRFEVSGAVGWAGSASLGTEQATLTGNGVPTGTPTVLFEAASSVDSGPIYEGRLGWRISRSFMVEGTAGIFRSRLRTRVTRDFEDAEAVELTERLNQFTIEAGLVAHLHRLAFAGRRVVPFLAGGGGYLRQLHDGETLATDGASGYAGGGVTVRFRERPRGFAKGLGLRVDVKARIQSGAFDLGDDRRRVYPVASGGLYLRF